MALIIVGNALLGVKRGIFREAFNLAGIAGGLFLGFRCYEALGWNLEGWLEAKPALANLAAFVVIFLGVAFTGAYLGYLLHKGAKRLFVGWLDHFAGGVFGLGRGLVFASVTALTLALFPFLPRLERDVADSALGPHVIKIAPAIYNSLMTRFRGSEHKGLDIKKLVDDYLDADDGTKEEPAPGP